MDRTTAISKVKKYAKLVTSTYSADKIVLFGSYATNTYREDSDVDVAVITSEITGDWLDMATQLCKLRRSVDFNIEPVLVDENNDPSGFVADILKHGIVVYEKSLA